MLMELKQIVLFWAFFTAYGGTQMLKITKEDIDVLSYQIEKSLSKEKLFSYIILMVLVDVIQTEDVESRLKEQLILLMLNVEEDKVFLDSFIRRRIVSTIYNDELFESLDSDSKIKQLIAFDEYCDDVVLSNIEEEYYNEDNWK